MPLPPLNALRAFEAAARHGGFIGAAEELHVTRGAISRHIKLLEARLGAPLFHRHANGVRLTAAGARLLPVLTEAFGSIARETARIATDAAELRILCPPATSIRWLIPRLEAFRQRHPEIRLRLTTDFHGDLGFDGAAYDLGFSVQNWPRRSSAFEVLPLFEIRLTPACAPALADRIAQPADLAHHTLLHESAAHADWRAWLAAFPTPGVDPDSGNDFSNLDLASRAAAMGAGVVMADLVLSREELAAGTLVAPFPDRICGSPAGAICLLGLKERWTEPKIRAFRSWVAEHAAAEAAQRGSGPGGNSVVSSGESSGESSETP